MYRFQLKNCGRQNQLSAESKFYDLNMLNDNWLLRVWCGALAFLLLAIVRPAMAEVAKPQFVASVVADLKEKVKPERRNDAGFVRFLKQVEASLQAMPFTDLDEKQAQSLENSVVDAAQRALQKFNAQNGSDGAAFLQLLKVAAPRITPQFLLRAQEHSETTQKQWRDFEAQRNQFLMQKLASARVLEVSLFDGNREEAPDVFAVVVASGFAASEAPLSSNDARLLTTALRKSIEQYIQQSQNSDTRAYSNWLGLAMLQDDKLKADTQVKLSDFAQVRPTAERLFARFFRSKNQVLQFRIEDLQGFLDTSSVLHWSQQPELDAQTQSVAKGLQPLTVKFTNFPEFWAVD